MIPSRTHINSTITFAVLPLQCVLNQMLSRSNITSVFMSGVLYRISWLIEDGNVPTSSDGGSDQLAQPSPSTLK